MGLKLANNAVSRLAAGISISDTSISMTPGTGALFPALSAGDHFYCTILKADGTKEIVKATARATDVLTVTRAQEGTAATAFSSGDRIEIRWTAQTAFDHVPSVINASTRKSSPVDADELAMLDSEASYGIKKFTIANLKALIFSAWGALINGGTAKATPVDADAFAIMDSAASNATKKTTIANLKATLKTYFDTLYAKVGAIGSSGVTMNTARLLGRTTSASGAVEEITVGAGLNLSAGSLSCTVSSLPAASTAEAQAGTLNTVAITPVRLKEAQIQRGTAVASTSGSAIDFTSIPSWAKRITILFSGVSGAGSSHFLIQIGSGSIDATGYSSGSSTVIGAEISATSTTGMLVVNPGSSLVINGGYVLTNILGNSWVGLGTFQYSNNIIGAGGSKTLAGTLDRVRITFVNYGIDTFDAGSINIMYE